MDVFRDSCSDHTKITTKKKTNQLDRMDHVAMPGLTPAVFRAAGTKPEDNEELIGEVRKVEIVWRSDRSNTATTCPLEPDV